MTNFKKALTPEECAHMAVLQKAVDDFDDAERAAEAIEPLRRAELEPWQIGIPLYDPITEKEYQTARDAWEQVVPKSCNEKETAILADFDRAARGES